MIECGIVTGAAGFLGSHIGIKLSKLGYDVYGVDNMIGGDDYNWSWLPREKAFKYDCSNLEQMLLVTKGMDIVYHCAATPHEGLSVFSPYTITQNNLMATVGVVTAAVQNKVKKIKF